MWRGKSFVSCSSWQFNKYQRLKFNILKRKVVNRSFNIYLIKNGAFTYRSLFSPGTLNWLSAVNIFYFSNNFFNRLDNIMFNTPHYRSIHSGGLWHQDYIVFTWFAWCSDWYRFLPHNQLHTVSFLECLLPVMLCCLRMSRVTGFQRIQWALLVRETWWAVR